MILHAAALIESYTAQGRWGSTTIDAVFRSNVSRYGRELAIADAPDRAQFAGGEPRRLNYQDLDAAVCALAAVFIRRGIGKDDIVLVQMPNIVEMFVTYLACARIGAVISPLPVQYGAHELRSILDTLGKVKAMVVNHRCKGEDFFALAGANLLAVQASVPLLAFGESPELAAVFGGAKAAADVETIAAQQRRQPVSANDIYSICWTSGTVATPKGVPLSHNNWLLYAAVVTEAGNIREREHLLNPFPCVNLSGLGISLLAWVYKAGTVFLHHPFNATVFLQQLQRERIGFTVAAPAVLNSILADEELFEDIDLSGLHSVMSGSAALSGAMITAFKQRFGIAVINGFGANEGVTLTSSEREVPDPARRAEYFPRIGSPDYEPTLQYHRWIETKLVEPDTGALITGPGIAGELLVRSGVVFPGYYNRPQLTRDAFDAEGYFRTGDLFEIAADEAGRLIYYRFVGRLKNLVIRGGMKIAPEELVAVINDHIGVVESEVVGYPDTILGERVCACVVLAPGATLTLDELVDFVRQRGLAKYKWPEFLKVVDELPKNPLGKVVRKRLLERILS